jgi:TonB family protein
MSFLSIIKSLPELVRQPSVIAALASLGIHALIAVSFPTLSASSKPEQQNTQGNVKVVELTPTEQSRLPQSSSPPLISQTQQLPTSPPLPYVALPVPGENSSSNIPIIRLPPILRYDVQRPNSRFNQGRILEETNLLRRRNTSGNYQLFGKRVFANRQFSIPQNQISNNRQQQEDNKRTQQSTASDERSLPTNNLNDPLLAEKLNSQNQSAETLNGKRQTLENSDSQRQPPENRPPETQTPKDTNSQTQPDNQTSQQTAQRDASRQQQLLADIRQMRYNVTYDDANTTNEQAARNYIAWALKQGIAQKPQEIYINGSYPKDACIKKLEGTAVVAVSVDANNKVNDPMLMKSSGYPIFNQKALQDAVNSGKFDKKPGELKNYLIHVKYEYDSKICPTLTVPQPSANGDSGSANDTVQ